jgi:Domain of unknown function (DUF397)
MTTDDLDLSRATWRTSTYSNNGGACIQVASSMAGLLAVRDSKDPGGPALAFTPGQWMAFTSTVKG